MQIQPLFKQRGAKDCYFPILFQNHFLQKLLPMIYFTLNELKINNNTILFIKQLAREYNKKRKTTMAKPEA